VVEGQHFYHATQNGIGTANVFTRQSSSGFRFHSIITHWGHSEKGMQKVKPKSKCGIKESGIEPNGHNHD